MDNSAYFLDNLDSNLSVKTDYEQKEYNYAWIDKFEDVLHYIDNILRNPKRFIINEEEIVKVELAKKVTVESVIHLTQHTNLIQDIDKNGDVKPSKILNINKDESLDTYENRFVFTLINNMIAFYNQRISNIGESYYYDKKELKYKGNTKIGSEEVNISLAFDAFDKKVSKANVNDRLKKIKLQLDGFTCTELMLTLSKLHVPPVRSPIRKTNVILKNPNFQKAVELWNYIQSFTESDCKVVKNNQDYIDNGELKSHYDHTFLLSYLNSGMVTSNPKKVSDKKVVSLAINRLIENIYDSNEDINTETIKKIFNTTLKDTEEKIKERDLNITKIFNDKISDFNDNISDLFKLLEV